MHHDYFTYCAGVVETQLDVLTGEYAISRVDIMFDCGERHVFSPPLSCWERECCLMSSAEDLCCLILLRGEECTLLCSREGVGEGGGGGCLLSSREGEFVVVLRKRMGLVI